MSSAPGQVNNSIVVVDDDDDDVVITSVKAGARPSTHSQAGLNEVMRIVSEAKMMAQESEKDMVQMRTDIENMEVSGDISKAICQSIIPLVDKRKTVIKLDMSWAQIKDIVFGILDEMPSEDFDMSEEEYQMHSNKMKNIEACNQMVSKMFIDCQMKLKDFQADVMGQHAKLDREIFEQEKVHKAKTFVTEVDNWISELERAAHSQPSAMSVDSDDDLQIMGEDISPNKSCVRNPSDVKKYSEEPPILNIAIDKSDDNDGEEVDFNIEINRVSSPAQSRPPQHDPSTPMPHMDQLRSNFASAVNKSMPTLLNSLQSQPVMRPMQGQGQGPPMQQMGQGGRPLVVPPPVRWPEMKIGDKVLGKKFNDVWYSGTVTDIVPQGVEGSVEWKCKVKYDGKGQKALSGRQVAYREPINCFIRVGTRVVALYREDDAPNSFFAGVIAEAPSMKNNKRFLVFFDDGYAQYCEARELHKVYSQSVNVWEDINIETSAFIKEYLRIYPERPMVRLSKGQVVRTEWNGKWWTSKVVEVDASLVKMYFQADKRTEWIYRGSTRLEPLFKALVNADAIKAAGSSRGRRHNLRMKPSNPERPAVEYTRGEREEADDAKGGAKKAEADKKKSNVAKKSTGGIPAHGLQNLPMSYQGDAIWELMEVSANRDRATCKVAPCKEVFMIHNSTTSILRHVQKMHPKEIKEARQRLEDAHQKDGVIDGKPGGSSKWDAPWTKYQRKAGPGQGAKEAPILMPPKVSNNPAFFPAHRPGASKELSSKDIASVLHERLQADTQHQKVEYDEEKVTGERKEVTIDNTLFPRISYKPHKCGPLCVKDSDERKEKHKDNPALRIPLLCGWERKICKARPYSKRFVVYRAPCGRHMRSIENTDYFLSLTDSQMTIDLFCFDHHLHVNTEFKPNIPVKTFCDIKDLSYGIENYPVSCVNGVDRHFPDYVEYANKRMPSTGVVINTDQEFLACCDCTDNCRDRSKCACQRMTIENSGGLDTDAGYYNKRLRDPLFTGLWECNKGCKCDRRCVNKVAQHGLQMRLQVFKTEKKGWGLRCLDDISKGSFICIYAGQLLTDRGANEDGKQYGDEYLAELDFIEVVESQKEGYESGAEEMDFSDDDRNDENYMASRDSDNDSDYGVGSGHVDGEIRRSKRKKSTAEMESDKAKHKEGSDKKKEDSKQSSSKTSLDVSDDEEEEKKPEAVTGKKPRAKKSTGGSRLNLSTSFSQSQGSEKEKGEKKKERIPTRDFFHDESDCYIMDAKSMGNLGRYLNHSCTPNVFVQNIFVDTHDLRFPWVAFFSAQYIRAGTELTWDYNYEVGSVPDKIMYCYCGSSMCRGRLL